MVQFYKGLAIDSATAGQRLYATDFHNGKVDIFDSSFHAVTIAGFVYRPEYPSRVRAIWNSEHQWGDLCDLRIAG
jgi:hypothetical protein